jgi:NAD(P)-dependent dehydrogenase (short-subunit alcohol dehydrogenase family)
MRLQDAVVVITGADSGIGAAGARLFAERGARVCLIGLKEENLQEGAGKLREAGHEVISRAADIREEDQISSAINAAVEEWGRLDVVWANAGIGGINAPIEQIGADEWDEVIETNLRGAFLTIKHAVPHLKKRGGAILITSSTSGNRTFTDMGATAYAVTKAAQVCLMKQMSVELGEHGIRVNAICPGRTATAIKESDVRRGLDSIPRPIEHPRGDMLLRADNELAPEEVAQAAVLVAQMDAVTATEIYADGGQSLIT